MNRKVLYKILGLLVFVCYSCVFFSCDNSRIVGEWREVGDRFSADNVKITWSFASDGSFSFKVEPLRRWQSVGLGQRLIIGNYKIKGNKIFLMHDGEINEWFYKRHRNHLKLGTEMVGFYQLELIE